MRTFGALPGTTCMLQGSTNLLDWVDITPLQTGTNGLWEFIENDASRYPHRFYRAVNAICLPASSGVVTAPFLITNGYVYQPIATPVVADGGRAAYDFSLASAGTYVVSATVSAPDGGANSFFVNMDAEPQSPYMIWDVPITAGFEQRLVSWRGNATGNQDSEFVPKVFTLAQGPHELIIRGREALALLRSLAIRQYP
jgi:hypothetical protein